MTKEWKTIAVSFAITLLILFAFVLGANSQEVREIDIQCYSKETGEGLLKRIAQRKGITIIELRGAEMDRFIKWMVAQSAPVPNDGSLTGINLLQIDASAGLGRPRTSFMIIRNQEPSHCSSAAFVMPPAMADAALTAVFGQKS